MSSLGGMPLSLAKNHKWLRMDREARLSQAVQHLASAVPPQVRLRYRTADLVTPPRLGNDAESETHGPSG